MNRRTSSVGLLALLALCHPFVQSVAAGQPERSFPAQDALVGEPSPPSLEDWVDFAVAIGVGADRETMRFLADATLGTARSTSEASEALRLSLDSLSGEAGENTKLVEIPPLDWVSATAQLRAGQDVQDSEVQFLADYLGLPVDGARQWAARSRELTAIAVAAQYMDHVGDFRPHNSSYVEILNESQSMEISVPDPALAEALSGLLSAFDDVSVRHVERSIADLLDEIALLRPQTDEILFRHGLPSEVLWFSEDARKNGIRAELVGEIDDTIASEIAATLGRSTVPVTFEQSTDYGEYDSCDSPLSCPSSFRAGMHLSGTGCTSGFVVVNSSGTRAGTTAAHCDNASAHSHGGYAIGNDVFVSDIDADDLDGKVFSISNQTFWSAKGAYYADHDSRVPVLGYLTQANAPYNVTLCHSGHKSFQLWGLAVSCGTLVAKYDDYGVMQDNVGRLDGCHGDSGDSGGPVFNPSTRAAYGLHVSSGPTWCKFSWSSDLGAISGYYPVIEADVDRGDVSLLTSPQRIVDTRFGVGGLAAWSAGQNKAVDVVSLASAVPTSARGVVINVTAVNPSAKGYLTVHPWSTTVPGTSDVNFNAGQTNSSMVIVGTGISDDIGIYASVATHIIVDVVGYLRPPSAADGFTTVTQSEKFSLSLTAGSGHWQSLAGSYGIPSNATGVLLNLRVEAPAAAGYLTVRPDTALTTSMLNFASGQNRENLAFVALNANGDARFYSSASATIDVDLLGYVSQSGREVFYTLPHSRLWDSSSTSAYQTVTLDWLVPRRADAAFTNLTVAEQSGSSGHANVNTSVNYVQRTVTLSAWDANSNHSAQDLDSNGQLRLAKSSGLGAVRRILDVTGYFE